MTNKNSYLIFISLRRLDFSFKGQEVTKCFLYGYTFDRNVSLAQCPYSFYGLDGHTIDKVGTVTYVAFLENVSGEFMFPISTNSSQLAHLS